jgi:enediyne biosynthesis protein E4
MLYRNTGRGFENVSKRSGPVFSKPIAGRGLAIGDFNNDGAVDALASVNDGAPILLRNNAGRGNHWLGLSLIGRKCNRDAIGAKVSYRASDLERHQFKVGGGSYLSYHDPRMVLGVGQRSKIDWLEVTWPRPSGVTERFKNLPIDRYITIVEGEGNWK